MVSTVAGVVCIALMVGAAVADSPKPIKLTPEDAKKFRDLDAQRRKVKWHQQKVPEHIHNATVRAQAQMIRSIPMVEKGGCGEKVSINALGFSKSPLVAQVLGMDPNSFLQTSSRKQLRGPPASDNHPGRDSWSKPGVGVEQELAEGASVGKVSGTEPYVTVLKDGWFEVGCFHDAMLEFGDKYGKGKFKYKMGDSANVSIARYSDLMLDEDKVPMTPTVCFEFCRTLPGQVFFGITEGRECYCMPFYKPQAGDAAQCDAVCEGDTTQLCGNTGGKSSVWEMHLCADTAQDLADAMGKSKEAMDFYYENVALAVDLGKKMSATGEKIEELGGLAGSKTAGDNGRTINLASKEYTQAYKKGNGPYATLLAAYKDGKSLEGNAFTDPKDTMKAEHAVAVMKPTTGEVLGLAAEVHFLNQLSYPVADAVVFADKPDSADAMATMLAKVMDAKTKGEDTFKNINFRDVAYSMGDVTAEPEASSCTGPTIGAPLMGLGLEGCAAACDATVSPQNCVAFSLYSADGVTDACVMLEDVKDIETCMCTGDAQAKGSPAGAKCMVKMSEVATGYKPKAEMKTYPRCFSTKKAFGVKAEIEELSLPSDDLPGGVVKAE